MNQIAAPKGLSVIAQSNALGFYVFVVRPEEAEHERDFGSVKLLSPILFHSDLPRDPTDWDQWIRRHRPDFNAVRARLGHSSASNALVEWESNERGLSIPTLAVFLVNRECPWHCLMCDLWKHTTLRTGPPGSIPNQISSTLCLLAGHGARHLKLYNAGSFFDVGAIPVSDYPAIAELCQSFARVIVESHPRLIGPRTKQFRDQLPVTTQLEVAMGLETVHPEILPRLNKGMTLEDFRLAAHRLQQWGARIRAFVLVRTPFMTNDTVALDWARRSLDFAWEAGVDVVSLIPTRMGNGSMEELSRRGLFAPPSWSTVEAAFEYGLAARKGLVFMDLWNLDPVHGSPGDRLQYARLDTRNRTQS